MSTRSTHVQHMGEHNTNPSIFYLPSSVCSTSNPSLQGSTSNVEREGVAREDFGSWLVWTDELDWIDREGRLLAERLAYLRERRRQVKRALADLGMDDQVGRAG